MKKKIVSITVFSLALLFLFAVGKPQAAMVEISLEKLVKGADLIVVGKVESVTSQMINGKICSFASIVVNSKIKGELAPEQSKIIVRFPGGEVGEIGMKVEDSPDYKKDEEAVVFLKNVPGESHYMTAGSSQGKYIIGHGIVVRENMPLDQFINRIEVIMTAGP